MGISERKEREKESRRNEIIDAAEKVFFNKGVDSATMDEVAEIAELSKGTLYIYFKNKEDLHFAICRRGLSILKEYFIKVVTPEKTVLENLIAIGISFVEFARTNTDYFKVMSHFENKDYTSSSHDHEHTEKDDVMNFLVSLIEKGMQDGSLRDDLIPDTVAHVLWAQTTGVLQLMSVKDFHLSKHHVTENDLILAHFEIIVNGIRVDKSDLDIKKYFIK
ncbi:MAG: TetR/AcrR family transcriptional regulator [Bacteroidales bacterium]|nr:TetR/AcrR family transcriptional regulator [Bacteroidales bacterium]